MNMPPGREVGLGPSNIVLDGDPAPLPKKATEPPIFGPCLLWPSSCVDKDATWYGGRPRPRQYCARWDPAPPPPKWGHSAPSFGPYLLWPNGWMDQYTTAVGLGPGHTVLDGDPATSKRVQLPIFGPRLLRPNSWMDKDVTWYGGRPRPRPHCARWGPSYLKKGTASYFRPTSVAAKQLDG